MRTLIALTLLASLTGCGKKVAKSTAPESSPGPTVAKAGPSGEKDKGSKTEKPNWLNDPRFKKEKPKDSVPDEAGDGIPGKPGWGLKQPEGGWNTANPPAGPGNPMVQPAAPQPGRIPPAVGGAGSPGTPTAGGKAVTRDDMNEVWIFIENRSGATGQMPAPETIYAALVEAKANAASLVKDGSIILTGVKTRDGIWAFEKNAPTRGGWVATQNGPEQLTAAQFAQRIGR